MKFKLLLLLYFISFSATSQNMFFKVNDKNWELSSKISLNNDERKKFKIKFSSLEDGKYFVFNRLLYGNKTAKAMAYFKEFDVYIFRENSGLKYLTFKEAFPKGGFYKDGALKTIFGQKVERYTLDNDVLDFKIWVADGVQVENSFIGFLKECGLLRNLPRSKNVIALSIQGLELDLSDIDKSIEKGRIGSNLEDILVTFKEKVDLLQKCIDSLPKKLDLTVAEFNSKIVKSFPYKITQNSVYVNRFEKKTQNFSSTYYSSLDGKMQFYVFPEENENGFNSQLIDYTLNKIYSCKIVNDDVFILKAKAIPTNDCETSHTKLLFTSENSDFYIDGKESKFFLIKYELDDKNYPTLTNLNFRNGFIKSYKTLDKYLNQDTVTCTIEKGAYSFNFSKL